MVVYKSTKKEFLEDFKKETLIGKIIKGYEKNVAKVTYNIMNSWNNSLPYLYLLLEDSKIPNDCGISIEQSIPNIDTKKRIDVMLTGKDKLGKNSIVLLELKQWSKVDQPSDKIGYIVTSNFEKSKQIRIHPSFQVWSYSYLLERYNSAFKLNNIGVYPCAYLHNYTIRENDSLYDNVYASYIQKAPLFVRGEIEKLKQYICSKISMGDNGKLIDVIDSSYVSIPRLFELETLNVTKNSELAVMIDEQQLIYDKAINMISKSIEDNKKRIMIVKGGPGTGKTVLAMKLLVDIMLKSHDQVRCVNYVTPVSNQRKIYRYILKQDKLYYPVADIIKNSGSFVDAENNVNDISIIDESHRLKEKSGLYDLLGENQTKEIIKSSKFCMFFIDDKQRVTLKDKGSIEYIKKIAKSEKIKIEICELISQFRCNGSSDYISWLEDVLQMKKAAGYNDFDNILNYDIRIVDTPNEMKEYILKKNKKNNASRIVAGYCWNSEKESRANPNKLDITIPKHNFSMSWNLINENWAIAEDSVKRAGCIYTCQGLEFEYVGVIIANDLIYRNGKVMTDYTKRARTDSALKGIKKMMKEDVKKAQKLADEIIKSTYRVLLTRGQKGCVVYCEDEELRDYLKERINSAKQIV